MLPVGIYRPLWKIPPKLPNPLLSSLSPLPCSNSLLSTNQHINLVLKLGLLDHALHLFDQMPQRDVVTWNMLIGGHARHGLPEPALDLYKNMVTHQRVQESPTTFCTVLALCGSYGFRREGLQVHSRVVGFGLQSNPFVQSALVNFYMRIGWPVIALKLFDEMPELNLAVCNSVLKEMLEMELGEETVRFFGYMRSRGVYGNGVSLCYLIRCCIDKEFVEEGRQLHCSVVKRGFVPMNVYVSNALVDMYSGCGNLTDAKRCLAEIWLQDVICWNSIVVVHAKNGRLFEAMEYFGMMLRLGWRASVRSLVALLNLSGRIRDLMFGIQIHGFGLKSGQLHRGAHFQSALIDMYGKCRKIRRSVLVFDEIAEKGLECCNSLVTSLMRCNAPGDVIEMFGIVGDEGARPDHVTFSAVLKALSTSAFGSLISCQELHCCVLKSGFQYEMAVSASLLDAYSKCGCMAVAHQIFNDAPAKNIVSFTALITGYARNGLGRLCLELLDEMVRMNIQPDAVTMLSVLTGCGHSGLVVEGQSVFQSMEAVYGVEPDQRHYSCMVDLLGRAGMIEEAMSIAKVAPTRNHPGMWSSLHRFCQVHRNETARKIDTVVRNKLESESHLQFRGIPSEGNSATEEFSQDRGTGCSLIQVGVAQ